MSTDSERRIIPEKDGRKTEGGFGEPPMGASERSISEAGRKMREEANDIRAGRGRGIGGEMDG